MQKPFSKLKLLRVKETCKGVNMFKSQEKCKLKTLETKI